MRKSTKFKILMLIMCLVFGNVFVRFLYLRLREPTKSTLKTIIRVEKKLTQKQKEDLVEMTEENSHLNYINNDCLTCEN